MVGGGFFIFWALVGLLHLTLDIIRSRQEIQQKESKNTLKTVCLLTFVGLPVLVFGYLMWVGWL